MPKSPTAKAQSEASSASSSAAASAASAHAANASAVQTKRTYLLALIAMGAFIVGRSTQLSWSQSDYLRFISSADLLSGAANATMDSYSALRKPPEPPLLRDAPYYINDKTMRLSPYVDRLWLHNGDLLPADNGGQPKPTVKLILTEMGWNQRNVKEGLTFVRSLRLREMMQAVIDHPLFDPTFSWTDMVSGRLQFDTSLQYFVFMDVETCFESNYPNYEGYFLPNADRAGNRTVKQSHECPCLDINGCPYIDKALRSPLFQRLPTARLFFFDCRGNGPDPKFRQERQTSSQLSIVSISSEPTQLLATSDMGHPPPAINPVRLSHKTRQQILHPGTSNCEQESASQRPYFLTCVGAVRNDIRRNLFELHNESAGVILMQTPQFHEKFHGKLTFQELLQKSLFAATPRGDNRFSYRFTEVLSSGAIPVIHSDGWVLPFRRELIDWSRDCAVVIPEAQVAQTLDILKAISHEERCQRRQRCYEVYTKYMANAEGTIRGVIESATRAIQSAQVAAQEAAAQEAAQAAAATTTTAPPQQ